MEDKLKVNKFKSLKISDIYKNDKFPCRAFTIAELQRRHIRYTKYNIRELKVVKNV